MVNNKLQDELKRIDGRVEELMKLFAHRPAGPIGIIGEMGGPGPQGPEGIKGAKGETVRIPSFFDFIFLSLSRVINELSENQVADAVHRVLLGAG